MHREWPQEFEAVPPKRTLQRVYNRSGTYFVELDGGEWVVEDGYTRRPLTPGEQGRLFTHLQGRPSEPQSRGSMHVPTGSRKCGWRLRG